MITKKIIEHEKLSIGVGLYDVEEDAKKDCFVERLFQGNLVIIHFILPRLTIRYWRESWFWGRTISAHLYWHNKELIMYIKLGKKRRF